MPPPTTAPGMSTPAHPDAPGADLPAAIDRLIQDVEPQARQLRHDLHAHPQLAYEETYASEKVQQALTDAAVPFQAGLADTGVVAWLRTDRHADAPAVLLRADMDALPIEEATGAPYASTHPGVMHACGHDGHTAALVGAMRVLAARRDQLPQPVKFFFQPA
ncbi:MAG: M20/M25/M40 family metallo-hydrolase, partial [Planctomycetota bacterium]